MHAPRKSANTSTPMPAASSWATHGKPALLTPMTRKPTPTACIMLATGLVLLVSGCSTPAPKPTAPTYAGKAHYKRITGPAGTHHYKLTPGQSWTRPTLQRNPDPVYPAALVHLALAPVHIVARLSVDKIGRVTAVYISKDDSQPSYRQAFEQAVRGAAMRWQFSPMKFTTTITRGDAPPRIIVVPKPFSMWFKFRFEVVDGKPVTSSRQRR